MTITENHHKFDLVIIVENERFKAHKVIISRALPFLRNFKENESEGEITLNNSVKSESFRVIMDYLYQPSFDVKRYVNSEETLLLACYQAWYLGMEELSVECDKSLSSLKDYDVELYTMSKTFGYLDNEHRMKSLLFRHMVPIDIRDPPGILGPCNLDFQKIPYELMVDTLHLFTIPEITLDYGLRHARNVQELGTVKSAGYRFMAVVFWIERHPEVELSVHHTILDCAGIREIPPNVINQWIRNLHLWGKPKIAEIFEKKRDDINDEIMNLKIRTTWVRVHGKEIDIADLCPEKKIWIHHRFRFIHAVKLFAVDQNIVYIVTEQGCLFFYDMEKTPSTYATFIAVLPDTFRLLNAYADNHVLYLYGTDIIIHKVKIIIYEERNPGTSQYNFEHNSIHYNFPSMTVQQGIIYHKYAGKVLEANLQTGDLSYVITLPKTNTELDRAPHLVKFGNNFYAFDDNGRYIKDVVGNRNVIPSPEILSVDKSYIRYSHASACATDEGLYVGLCNIPNQSRPGPFKLMRESESGEFQCIGYVSDPNFDSIIFDESAKLVLRKNYGSLV